jgi:glycerol-3-phosphate responsive antiterminator
VLPAVRAPQDVIKVLENDFRLVLLLNEHCTMVRKLVYLIRTVAVARLQKECWHPLQLRKWA